MYVELVIPSSEKSHTVSALWELAVWLHMLGERNVRVRYEASTGDIVTITPAALTLEALRGEIEGPGGPPRQLMLFSSSSEVFP